MNLEVVVAVVVGRDIGLEAVAIHREHVASDALRLVRASCEVFDCCRREIMRNRLYWLLRKSDVQICSSASETEVNKSERPLLNMHQKFNVICHCILCCRKSPERS